MRSNKKTAIIIIIIASALILSLILGVVVYFNQHNIFVFAQNHKIGKDASCLEVTDVQTEKITLSEAQTDSRFCIDQSLVLINTTYLAPKDYPWQISEYKSTTVYMNDCMKDAYAALSSAVTERTDRKLYVSSDVRDREEQQALYLEDPHTATLPGASEHETGLCVDVYIAKYAGDAFLKSESGRFVNAHAHEYGFIIRYPSYGENSTGVRFEPWHIRYVGFPHAEYIYNNNLTLEEYILSLEADVFYRYGDYIISRQSVSDGALNVPTDAKSVTISPDNTGYYIVTSKMI